MKSLTQISRRSLFVAPLALVKWFVEGVVASFTTIRFTDWCFVAAAFWLHPGLGGMVYMALMVFRVVEARC